MINQVTLVGRTTEEAKFTLENEIKHARVSLAVQRNFKNPNGKNDVDFVPLNIWHYNAEFIQRVHKGSVIAVTGRLINVTHKSKFGNTYSALEVSVDIMSVIKYRDPSTIEDFGAEMPENHPYEKMDEAEDVDMSDQILQEDQDYALQQD